jgi:hypothetical protein
MKSKISFQYDILWLPRQAKQLPKSVILLAINRYRLNSIAKPQPGFLLLMADSKIVNAYYLFRIRRLSSQRWSGIDPTRCEGYPNRAYMLTEVRFWIAKRLADTRHLRAIDVKEYRETAQLMSGSINMAGNPY